MLTARLTALEDTRARGRDIMAACGQLKSESVKQRASERLAEEKIAAMRSAELARMPS